ncbi:MAG: carotenoid biosynthesis protein [Thermomicrobiales bacterium]
MGRNEQQRTGGIAARGPLAPWFNAVSLLGSAVNAGLALRHSLRARGARNTAIFAALGIGLPTLGEWYAVNIDRTLRHHSGPQLRGVPLNASVAWWTIASATLAVTEEIVARGGASEAVRRWATPVGSALVATSLDLVLDPYGLANGFWEWRDDGAYAREITGANGRSGIPVGNYLSWLVLVGGVTALYGALMRRTPPRAAAPATTRDAAGILLSYYFPAALWALKERRPRYLLNAALFPAAIALALWPRRAQPENQSRG